MKTCTKCGVEKALSEFGKSGNGNGYRLQCRACRRAQATARYAANPEKRKAASAAWRAANPGYWHACDENRKVTTAAWRAANPEKVKAARAARYAADPEGSKAGAAAWYKANPEKVRARTAADKRANPEKWKAYNAAYHAANPLRSTWQGMKRRCGSADPGYKNYGGRGITICDRWSGKDGLSNFVADMGERPSPKHSLDRIDVDGNYEPSNCRWATAIEQGANKRPKMFVAEARTAVVELFGAGAGVRFSAYLAAV